jgi:hypothetical protein
MAYVDQGWTIDVSVQARVNDMLLKAQISLEDFIAIFVPVGPLWQDLHDCRPNDRSTPGADGGILQDNSQG